MESPKDKSILMGDLAYAIDELMTLVNVIKLEIEWSSDKRWKQYIRSAVSGVTESLKDIQQLAERFYDAKYLSENNGCDSGSTQEWRSGESAVEEALERELDSQKWLKQKAIQRD